MRQLVWTFALAACLAGCGGSTYTGPEMPAGAGEEIVETHALLLEAAYGGGPLKSAKDVEPYSNRFPKAAAAIKNGDIKVVWGKAIKDNAPKPEIVAYEKSAESGEGWAIKEDGKLHKVSSADVSKLPKSK